MFCRDDDVGWADERLWPLVDVFVERDAPLDLAVIPRSVRESTAAKLRSLPVGVHQHGLSHQNHEREGRKCEFGDARDGLQQCRDIAAGRSIMQGLFGEASDSIFTPPWNRCSRVTGECLLELGIHALSRDVTALPLRLAGLVEIPVHIDWTRPAVADLLAAAIAEGGLIGIMFHHAAMDDDEVTRVAGLLAVLQTSTATLWSMADVLGRQPDRVRTRNP